MATIENSKYLVIDGGTVKTEEDGLVTGLGIVFGSETDTDQSKERDFFTAKSHIRKKAEFTIPLYYDHGVGVIRDEVGEATLTKTADGWFTSAKIDISDPLGQQVYEAVKAEPHGFSTGALTHLVVREAKANGSHFLKKWVPGEMSLTKRPAERKAVVQSVKSIDGEVVYENMFDSTPAITVELLDEAGTKVWDITDDIKSLSDIKNAKTLNIKDISGSVNYSVYITSDEPDDNRGASISVYEWGGIGSFIARLQELVNIAAAAGLEDDAEDAADDVEDANEPDTLDVMGIKNKDLNKRIQTIVKSMLDKNQANTAVLESKLDEKEGELVELRQSLAASEKALADLKREQYVEILAGADETIKNTKGK